jgi:hypothetical protein
MIHLPNIERLAFEINWSNLRDEWENYLSYLLIHDIFHRDKLVVNFVEMTVIIVVVGTLQRWHFWIVLLRMHVHHFMRVVAVIDAIPAVAILFLVSIIFAITAVNNNFY